MAALYIINIFVIIFAMPYTIEFYNERVQEEINALSVGLRVRFALLVDRMIDAGPNLGEPHTKTMGKGLFEMRLKSSEGIARVFYCALVGKRIVMLHSFVKKDQKTPTRELQLAQTRLKEVKK
jgi:phage-related protein